jgi:adenine-specific DNA methylase
MIEIFIIIYYSLQYNSFVMAYSSKTKEGNWCEDAFGASIYENRTIEPLSYATETTTAFINPKLMNDTASNTTIKIESTYELKVKNKEGLSYEVLFDHGYPSTDRFYIPSRSIPEGTLHQRKQATIRQEQGMGTTYTTQSKLAGALLRQVDSGAPGRIDGETVDIPDFRRTFPMSGTVPQWFK